MKSLFALILLAFIGQGCKKCAHCTTETVTKVSRTTPGYPQTIYSTFDVCGSKDIKEVDGMKTVATSTSMGITATTTATTTCKMKESGGSWWL